MNSRRHYHDSPPDDRGLTRQQREQALASLQELVIQAEHEVEMAKLNERMRQATIRLQGKLSLDNHHLISSTTTIRLLTRNITAMRSQYDGSGVAPQSLPRFGGPNIYGGLGHLSGELEIFVLIEIDIGY